MPDVVGPPGAPSARLCRLGWTVLGRVHPQASGEDLERVQVQLRQGIELAEYERNLMLAKEDFVGPVATVGEAATAEDKKRVLVERKALRSKYNREIGVENGTVGEVTNAASASTSTSTSKGMEYQRVQFVLFKEIILINWFGNKYVF